MRLTRRDALAALAAVGVGGAATAVLLSADGADGPGESSSDAGGGDGAGESIAERGDAPVGSAEMATLVAAAEVLYPSEIENVEEFVTEYVRGRAAEDPDHAAGMADAAAYLEEYARAWYDAGFVALDRSDRDAALERMGADTSDPDPAGSDVERVRYYVVDELLFALYATPTGGELVGLENPPGHPGGLESYQRGPKS